MNQCDRIKSILQENKLKQKELAAGLGVTESYISVLLKKPEVRLSRSIAALIEEKYGYSADWVLSGAEPKLKRASRNRSLSELHQKALAQLEKRKDDQVKAVLAFINSQGDIEKSLAEHGENAAKASRTASGEPPENL